MHRKAQGPSSRIEPASEIIDGLSLAAPPADRAPSIVRLRFSRMLECVLHRPSLRSSFKDRSKCKEATTNKARQTLVDAESSGARGTRCENRVRSRTYVICRTLYPGQRLESYCGEETTQTLKKTTTSNWRPFSRRIESDELLVTNLWDCWDANGLLRVLKLALLIAPCTYIMTLGNWGRESRFGDARER